MPKRPPCPPGTPWLSPYLTVRDAAAATAFYAKAFGFETKMAMPGPDGKQGHTEMTYKDALLMFGPEQAAGSPCKAPVTSGTPPAVSLYVYCDDVDALYQRAVAAGARVEIPPQDMFWGDRMCKLVDPDGHIWTFATNVADFDPNKVPK
jgi:uncharacterized glyoxalase superfamily protein PhnB